MSERPGKRERRADAELIAVLRCRLADANDLLDLAHHDIDRILARDEAFRRQLLELLDAGRIAEARRLIRWGLNK